MAPLPLKLVGETVSDEVEVLDDGVVDAGVPVLLEPAEPVAVPDDAAEELVVFVGAMLNGLLVPTTWLMLLIWTASRV